MWVREVYDLFSSYIDEADDTTMTPAQRQLWLKVAYDQFRNLAVAYDPFLYTATASITPNAVSYDLSAAGNPTRLLGNPGGGLTGPRLQKLLAVERRDATTGSLLETWATLSTPEELDQYGRRDRTYLFTGTSLRFPWPVDLALTLVYRPVSTVDWSKTAAGDNEFIDDFEEWHDLIALMAYGRYAIRDGALNAQINAELQDRRNGFMGFLASGRDVGAARIVMVR